MKAFLGGMFAGLLIGAIFTTMAGRVIESRRDPWPSAVMVVIDHDFKELRRLTGARQCGTPEAAVLLHRLQDMAREIEPALMADGDDRVFRQYAGDFRSALAKLADAGSDCPRTETAITDVRNSCQACHRDYR